MIETCMIDVHANHAGRLKMLAMNHAMIGAGMSISGARMIEIFSGLYNLLDLHEQCGS